MEITAELFFGLYLQLSGRCSTNGANTPQACTFLSRAAWSSAGDWPPKSLRVHPSLRHDHQFLGSLGARLPTVVARMARGCVEQGTYLGSWRFFLNWRASSGPRGHWSVKWGWPTCYRYRHRLTVAPYTLLVRFDTWQR